MRLSAPRPLITFAVCSSFLTPVAVQAQGNGYSPIVVQWPGGTRAAAMANASVAVRDVEALYYNPAEIGVGPPIIDSRAEPRPVHSAAVAWQRMGTATLHSVGAVFQAGTVGIGVGARHLDLDAAGLPLSASEAGFENALPASSIALVAGAAREVKGVRLGASVTYGSDQAGDQRSGSTMFDFGVAKAIRFFAAPLGSTPGPLHVGIAVQHLGARATLDGGSAVRPPTVVTVGANLESFPKGVFDISGGVGISVRRDGRVIPRTGWELAWFWIDGYAIEARAGARRPEFDGQSPVTLGLGALRDNISLDYAFEPAFDLPPSHRVGIRVR